MKIPLNRGWKEAQARTKTGRNARPGTEERVNYI
jgi:hypothetical protein